MRGKTNRSHHFFLNFLLQLSTIALNSDRRKAYPLHQPEKKTLSAQKMSVLLPLLPGFLCACEAPAQVDSAASPPPTAYSCGENGAASASIFGGIETQISWTTEQMDCDSMQRPDSEGVRLRFIGDASGERLAIIIAMPGLEQGKANVEVPSNVTATVEGSGRFFSTPNLGSCWTEVSSQVRLRNEEDVYAIAGTLFCVAPLGEINGNNAVSIPEFSFSTIVNWGSQ